MASPVLSNRSEKDVVVVVVVVVVDVVVLVVVGVVVVVVGLVVVVVVGGGVMVVVVEVAVAVVVVIVVVVVVANANGATNATATHQMHKFVNNRLMLTDDLKHKPGDANRRRHDKVSSSCRTDTVERLVPSEEVAPSIHLSIHCCVC